MTTELESIVAEIDRCHGEARACLGQGFDEYTVASRILPALLGLEAAFIAAVEVSDNPIFITLLKNALRMKDDTLAVIVKHRLDAMDEKRGKTIH